MVVILLRLSPVQTYLGKIATSQLNKTYNTNIVVKKVDLSFIGDVNLKQIEVLDHKNDSLIFVKSLTTSVFSYKNIVDNRLELGEVDLEGVIVKMTTHKGEEDDNLNIFIDKFDDGKEKDPNTPSFLMTSPEIRLKDVSFFLTDRNSDEQPIVFYKNISGKAEDFKIEGSNVSTNIRNLAFIDNFGIEVTDLSSDFSYTRTQMLFANTKLETKYSSVKADITFDYKREDLANFNDKVQIKGDFKDAEVSLIDLNKFYDELGVNDKVKFTTIATGTLNNFKLNDLQLTSKRNSIIDGVFHFKNVVNRERGFSLDARIYNLASTYNNLKQLLPNLLGKTLPTSLNKLGRFSLAGQSFITEESVDADLMINSQLGRTISNLQLTNIDNIDEAKYKGNVEFVNFDLGKVVNDSLVGKTSLALDVDGEGFTLEKIKTSIKGTVPKFQYRGYEYKNLSVNGVFENQLFDGVLTANDENLQMTFKGLADLSEKPYKFDFKTNIAHSNFNTLNLFTRDEKAILKGDIDINLVGSSIDNVVGEIRFKNTSYTNQNDNYFFQDFNITSVYKDNVRELSMNSSEIVDGKIRGNFKFSELPLLAKNSLGSIYTNFKPEKVTSGQFLDFNFKIYNKIVGVFFPEVNLGANSTVKGKINSDEQKFELLVKSPKVEAYENVVENIRLQVDNQNPLYNTLLSINKVDTKYYNVADVNLVNVTLNDTLFFRTDFVGGKKRKEKFDLSFYHTINEDNKSVVGLKRSTINFKDNEWIVNEDSNNQNKVVFDNKFKTFAFDRFSGISGIQKIDFFGVNTQKGDKDLHLDLENVNLNAITPEIEGLVLNGLVNGKVNYRQIQGQLTPKATLAINNLDVNKVRQGNLMLEVSGDQSLKKYIIDASLKNDNIESFVARGEIDFEGAEPTLIANYSFDKFQLKAFNPLGEGVLDKLRGEVSGKGIATGLLENPDLDGELYLKDAGLAFPYLNIDFDIEDNSKITLDRQVFDFNQTKLKDVVYDTEAVLSGTISHEEFLDWFIDLKVDSNNLLVLNTKESEEPYYGTGFLNGNATFKGFTDNLIINVEGKTMPRTEFIIPLSDVSTIGESKLIKFTSDTNKSAEDPDKAIQLETVKGLALNFDLEVTEDALAEIVVDKNTGSVLQGRGAANLYIAINTLGKFEMIGTYVVSNGIYEFRNIVDKDFIVQPGGSIIWTGNPFNAYLNNITATYRTKANPKVLLTDVSSREIDVDLIAKITGQLFNSNIEFDLDIPNANSVVQSELQFKLNDQDRKMTQFLSLLTTGSFTPIDEASFDFGALGGTILSEKVSNILSNILKNRGEVFDVGLSYATGQRNNFNEALNTDDQLGITASARLGKKVTINGKVGVPVGGNTQSRVVGEVEAELPLNKSETFRAKVYNRQNEVQFTVADEEGYTQGIGLSYRVDFDNGKELVNKVFGSNQDKKKNKKSKDSLKVKKKLVQFSSVKKDSTQVKNN